MAATPPRTRVRLVLHRAQREIFRSEARFRVAATGRRFGKTTLAVGELVVFGAQNPAAVLWWVAPTYQQSRIAFRMLLGVLPKEVREVNRSEREVTLWNGARIAFKSADNADNLRGEGVAFVVVDEAAYVKEEAWTASLRPALSDTRGRALLISTFRGENFFFDLYERGRDPGEEYADWQSFRFETADNPHIPAEEIEEARRTLPEAVFEQEYMANPLVYVGAVFPGMLLQAALDRGSGLAHAPGLVASAGLDWGHNVTALEVCQEDASENIRWIDERIWHAVELNRRCAEIVSVCRERSVLVIYSDAAGATENATLATALRNAGLKTVVQPVPFGKFKQTGIMARRYYLENGREAMSPKVQQLARDSKRYRYKEGADEVVKEDDHSVDAATAFYASKAGVLVGLKKR